MVEQERLRRCSLNYDAVSGAHRDASGAAELMEGTKRGKAEKITLIQRIYGPTVCGSEDLRLLEGEEAGRRTEGGDQVVSDCYSIAFTRLILLLGSLLSILSVNSSLHTCLLLSALKATLPPRDALTVGKEPRNISVSFFPPNDNFAATTGGNTSISGSV